MAINITTDPRTRKQMILAEGKVDGVFFNELKEKKTYTGPKGQPWTPTHALSVVIDGVRVSLGLTEKDKLNAKDIDGNYHQIVKGVEVSAEVEENGEYKGVKQYQTKASKILVLDASGAIQQPAQQQCAPQGSQNASGSSTSFKKDSIGVLQGHALKGAGMLVARDIFDKDDILSAAKFYHHITKNVKEWYTENSEGLSEYDIGNGAGNAVNTAAQYAGMDEIESEAIKILQLLPKLSEFIKNGNEAVKEEKKPVQKPKPQPKPVEQEPDFDDFSDDVPF